jgi:RHH-type transcriptional regulator, proline utilization regulon repressor / proline dehydrogenase / delta 1-pyrroline-5-carboxylate dehydrogenase
MDKAKQILESVKDQTLSPDQRREKAIELAGLMLEESRRIQSYRERSQQKLLARMMNDPVGKAFTTSMTDQCFRSSNNKRVADQLVFLIKKFGIPKFLNPWKKFQLFLFRHLGQPLAPIAIPLLKRLLRKTASNVILPGEPKLLSKHIAKRRKEGVRVNLNHLGEAILGEDEAEHRLNIYLRDLTNPQIGYISVKISTIFSQISLLDWENSLEILAERLKELYRAAKAHPLTLPTGRQVPKFVNLDMEEYRDLHLTVALFKKVLEDGEFYQYSAGIVLQSYLPDAFLYQQELTEWAMNRVKNGGAPIKIRLVKGANLAMEQVEASLKGWPQAPYLSKTDADANYKRMLVYACEPERIKAAHIGVGSHNLFDIAYAMLLKVEKNIAKYMTFEMLEGMADSMRRVVQSLGNKMLLYCPAANKDEFQNAIAYLVRRLDENTAPDNFLRHAFEMRPGTAEWKNQADLFSRACKEMETVGSMPMRDQSRFIPPVRKPFNTPFENEVDTDWSLPPNIRWAESILKHWSGKEIGIIPLVIGGKEVVTDLKLEQKMDPSCPKSRLYQYVLAGDAELETTLQTAEKGFKLWSQLPLKERLMLIDNAAHQLRCHRDDLIGAMIADTSKTVTEADVEVSEAIDFAAYYRRSAAELHAMEDLLWTPKGTVLVAPPWNFPCSIPAGGILAALAAGNAVIFKPAPEAVLVGWMLVNALWEAGISKEVLQFFCCPEDPIGTHLIRDPRIAAIVLTGATSTAKQFMKWRPDMDLIAETGGKNALIVTQMADRDLAIKDLLQSAFGHAGQKCSACSLAILEKEVYDDPHFRRQLLDAASSLKVGSPWDLSTKVNPLIRKPGPELMRALTTLEEGEEWLLQPKQDTKNPHLWSPGIKFGVRPGSFTHQTELFGPVLGVMRADNLQEALIWANGTRYGLTAGIHTLDEREQDFWSGRMIAGNCYINRGITGAIVRRQPFGGCKESGFGPGAKAGGPNYLMQLMHVKAVGLPTEKEPFGKIALKLNQLVQQEALTREELNSWVASCGSYAFNWNHYFSKPHDPNKVAGEHNFLRYIPLQDLALRVQEEDSWLDLLKVIVAASTCGSQLEISISAEKYEPLKKWLEAIPSFAVVQESDAQFAERIKSKVVKRVRFLSLPSRDVQEAMAFAACHHIVAPVMPNGRIELLRYLREASFSIDYHRYGYVQF